MDKHIPVIKNRSIPLSSIIRNLLCDAAQRSENNLDCKGKFCSTCVLGADAFTQEDSLNNIKLVLEALSDEVFT